MEKKNSLSIEITIISAEDLRLNRRLIKKNSFVTVRADSYNSRSTSLDVEGGGYPSWNEKLDLPLPYSAQFITVEVQCKVGSGLRTVGTANVPVSDFMGECTPADYLHFLSYRLRERDGERNGIINLSIRMKLPNQMTTMTSSSQTNYQSCIEMAVGIPVSYRYMV